MIDDDDDDDDELQQRRELALGRAWDIVLLLDDLNKGDPGALDRLRKCVGWVSEDDEPPTLGDMVAYDLEQYYALEHGGWEPSGLAVIKEARQRQMTDLVGMFFILDNGTDYSIGEIKGAFADALLVHYDHKAGVTMPMQLVSLEVLTTRIGGDLGWGFFKTREQLMAYLAYRDGPDDTRARIVSLRKTADAIANHQPPDEKGR
jgi:hypothetical protein